MSLILRQLCQPILDEYGLDSYYVSIKSYQHYMYIVSACGQELFSITNIKFSKEHPSKADAQLGANLLIEFFEAHLGTLNAYLDAKLAFNQTARVPTVDSPYSVEHKVIKGKSTYTVGYSKNNEHLYFTLPGKIYTYSTHGVKLPKIGNLAQSKAVLDDLNYQVKIYMNWHKAKVNMEDKLSLLTACKI